MMTEDRYPKAFAHLIEVEGGFVNDAVDRGGATKYGITIPTLAQYMTGKTPTIDDIKALTLKDAERIYFVLFWEPMNLDSIRDDRLAFLIFDQAVNRGQVSAVRLLQKALNKNLDLTDLKEDGVIGPRTISILNDQIPELVGLWYLEECQLSYARICEYNQTQLRFLRGWLSRTHKLQRMFWDKKEG